MAGVFTMLAGGLGAKSRNAELEAEEAKEERIRRQSSFDKLVQSKSLQEITNISLARDFEEPCDVYSWFEITLTDVNVINQTFDASIEIHVFWQDFSFPFVFPDYKNGAGFEIDEGNLPIKMSEIFENQILCEITVNPIFEFISETSTIYMFFVVQCTFVERMELQRFPLDRQFLGMQFNAYQGVSPTGNWNWILKPGLEWVPKKYRERNYWVRMLASIGSEYELLSPWIDFNIESDNNDNDNDNEHTVPSGNNPKFFQQRSKSASLDNNNNTNGIDVTDNSNTKNKNENENENEKTDEFSSAMGLEPLSILLRLNRRPHYYYGNIVFPNFLIGLGCGTAFIVDSTELADRLGVLITLMLASVAFRFVVSTMLPRVTYLTIMDGYLLLSFISIIVLICENAIVAIPNLFNSDWVLAFDYTFGFSFYIFWGFIHFLFAMTLIFPEFGRVAWKAMADIDSADEDKPVEANQYRFVSTNKESTICRKNYEKWKKEPKDE